MHIASQERLKYEEMWQFPEYRNGPQGPKYLDLFLDEFKPGPYASFVELGCGSGITSILLHEKHPDMPISLVDITDVGLDQGAKAFPFFRGSLWNNLSQLTGRYEKFNYGYCCDVMEHIPPEFSMLVLSRILDVCHKAFFSVSFTPDTCGQLIGKTLHVNVQDFVWWRTRFHELARIHDARDLMGVGLFFVESMR